MAEPQSVAALKERSPSYPFIPLEVVLQRLTAFDQTFGRHPTPASKVGLAWGMKEKSSQAAQVLAALKSFELVRYEGGGDNRVVHMTDVARTYLRAQQDSVKQQVVKDIALKPKLLNQFWNIWGQKRPIDAVCLDALVLTHRFTDSAAQNFLKVYDATIAFAGLKDSDTATSFAEEEDFDDAPPASSVKVGDFVLIEIGGVLQFKEPKQVRAIQEYQGQDWVFIDGSESGFEMSQVILQDSATFVKTPPRLPIDNTSEARGVVPDGWSEETLIDDGGDEIRIRYLGKASVDRYKFIRDYLDFKISRLETRK
ncbi:hypothetical protein [Agrobacterium rubi]|uniref:Uncharacterized protein n=1 Tax=Agrobacterium rubi TaxID=28099 RepID=A0AAE7UQ61_9HYPH|nr:hypothetical protein [Agrobacterium rubi]NTE89133.1 hypothetical protein [Agrobacterium rubi]NTF04915.1 hypothetical protein [Agrobacterium rubi]NTF38685.1 hypothetical protein [Agrobacterium rubi]OCJ43266.1 hypothetical protein A6U92_20855 [Agrobacterium rubi]QTF99981.1 hypothetical protein G6M88_06025 [Agrobacterium rubi]